MYRRILCNLIYCAGHIFILTRVLAEKSSPSGDVTFISHVHVTVVGGKVASTDEAIVGVDGCGQTEGGGVIGESTAAIQGKVRMLSRIIYTFNTNLDIDIM